MKKMIVTIKGFVLVSLMMALMGLMSINAQTVSTFASGFGQAGDVAFDSSGNMYVAARNQNKIMKVTPAGAVSTFAGSGTYGKADGAAASAQFRFPRGLTVDPSGNVFVTEDNNYNIRKITPAGVVSTVKDFTVFGEGPSGILADPSGNIFYFHRRELHKLAANGTDTIVAGSMGCNTQFNGAGTAACFAYPTGLARDSSGNLYTVENSGSYSEVRKISPTYQVSSVGPRGQLGQAIDIAVDSTGNIYVATGTLGNSVKKVTPTGVISNYAGIDGTKGATDGPAATATFSGTYGLAFSGSSLYVADYNNGKARKIQ